MTYSTIDDTIPRENKREENYIPTFFYFNFLKLKMLADLFPLYIYKIYIYVELYIIYGLQDRNQYTRRLY